MMNAAIETALPIWRLTRIEDLRGIDFASGKRVPLSAGEGHLCDRCDREHALVFHITDGVRSLAVGSGCVKVATGGWEPSDVEMKRARKVLRDEVKTAMDAKRREDERRSMEAFKRDQAILDAEFPSLRGDRLRQVQALRERGITISAYLASKRGPRTA